MNINKIIISTVIIILLIIGIPTIYKVINTHENNLYKVNNKLVIEAYIKCLNESNCKDENTTLEDLYNKEYLSNVVDPITKKFYNNKSYITKKDNNYKFIIVN